MVSSDVVQIVTAITKRFYEVTIIPIRPLRFAHLSFVITAGLLASCSATISDDAALAAASTDSASYYSDGRKTRDGIGRYYLGREISQVMGHRGASWLERPDREREERTDLLVGNLPLGADSVVADIGAGTGYFSFRIAMRVPQGEVLAVDIQQEMLDIIEARKAQGAPQNVRPVLGTEYDPGIGAESVDLILIVDAYHEFSYPREMGDAMAAALKPAGRLVLIEYRGEDPAVPIKPLHKMTQKQVKKEMQAIGLQWERTEDFLPQQHFMVFSRQPAR